MANGTETKPGQQIIVVPQKGTDWLTILAIGAGVGGIGFGAWWLLSRKVAPEFELIQPTASPGVIAVGAQTTISAGVKNISKSEQDVDVRLQIFQAGFAELMGPQIDEGTTRLTIAPGATGYATMQHTGTIGGPTSNGIAMRHVIISTLVGGKVIGTPWTAKNVFGVSVEGETVSFTVGQPVVGGVSYPNAKVLAGDTVTIKIKVTNTGSQPQKVSLHASVHEHSTVGTGDAIGTPYNSPETTLGSGQSADFSFNHVAAGTVDNTRDIVTEVYMGAGLAPNTGPNNPNVFRNAFSVIAKPVGVSFSYGTLTVHTPSGTLQEPEGSPVIFHVEVTNTGTQPCSVHPYFRVREESLTGTGDWASDEIEGYNPLLLGAKETGIFAFPWLVAGAVGRKTGVLYLKNATGAVMDHHDYGGYGNPVIELIVQRTLTIVITPEGAGTVNVKRGDGSTASNVTSLIVRYGEIVTLIPNFGKDNFMYFTDEQAETITASLTMDRDRTVTAHFWSVEPPPKVSIRMHLTYWPGGARTWTLQHFDAPAHMDFESSFVAVNDYIDLPNISAAGNFGVRLRDAEGAFLVISSSPSDNTTVYSSPIQVNNNGEYAMDVALDRIVIRQWI